MKNEKSIPGIYLKSEWEGMFSELSHEEVGKLIKNCYNYMNKTDLIEMSRLELMLFNNSIVPVLKFNTEKYKEKCERNIEAGKKGGRPKKITQSHQSNLELEKPNGFFNNPKKPDGYSGNPEKPKDIDIDKDKTKDTEIDKVIDREITTAREKTKIKNNEIEILKTGNLSNHKNDIERFKNLLNTSSDSLLIPEEQTFYLSVKELVLNLGWEKFEEMIFCIQKNELNSFLFDNEIPELLPLALEVRTHYPYFLNKLLK